MSNPLFHLENIMDLEKWHKLQDSLALVTKMAIITVDYKGIPVTKHSYCQPFCQGVRKDSVLSSYCQKCDARGGLEAVRLDKPYIYKCHFNIIDIAVPIIIDNQYIGAVMAGQIKLRDADSDALEQIVSRPSNSETDHKFKALEEDYLSLPILSYEEVSTIADMLFHLCHYIVEEAIHKNATIELYKKTLSIDTDHPFAESMNSTDLTYRNIQAMQSELSSTLIDNQIKRFTSSEVRSSNPLLQPAFDYIYHHKNENITLTKLAKLCHISPSYFSRIFMKETGENFSVFTPRIKMEWAKQLLETTEQSINQISDDLGFCDAGYFIKTFKKFESLTPAVYRSIYREKHEMGT
ncbi:PocR ligand-binding domain-containing protein [Paenibacillus crassostreae]|uniref:Transcriptional regulator n=1 Tax=Paenibacillus crassostreae TaxID=1763538 RepID=A0A162KZF4_9BACL|nr:PocR ligand-binding domain-containing protein [Paenibacillus crassostreae]AOZ93006.1 transcriptional regulator [Paenibacillus crassostreae]OAB71905.1 transcriptional regulator [Paenibacillus crassostreae]